MACVLIISPVSYSRKMLARRLPPVLDWCHAVRYSAPPQTTEDSAMGNRDKGKKEIKKPKKDLKVSTALRETPAPVAVDVVPRKRKDRVEAD